MMEQWQKELLQRAELPTGLEQIYGKHVKYTCDGADWREGDVCGVIFGGNPSEKRFDPQSIGESRTALMICLGSETLKTRPVPYLLTEDGVNWELVEYRGIFSDPRKNGWFRKPVRQISFM